MPEKQINSKSTKNVILQAYDELLKKVQEQKLEETKTVAELNQKKKVVEQATLQSNEGIVKNIANLKINLNAKLDELEDDLLNEFKKFTEIKEALKAEEKRLQEVYQISVNVDSLAALLLAQKEKKEQFELEMSLKKEALEGEMKESREAWQKEKQKLEQSYNELKEETEKQRNREEEEYVYNLKLNRKKEEDTYQDKKQAFEKEIEERKKEWEIREDEYKMLKKQVEGFSKEIKEAISRTKLEVERELVSSHKFEKELLEKETEGEMKLLKQTIINLENKIKEQTANIVQLTKKTDNSSDQIKEIAIKAIEGASNQRILIKEKEISEKDK